PFHEYQFILGNNVLSEDVPIKMQRIDFHDIERVTHHLFYPVVLRLAADQPYGFLRDWVIATVSPERHLGYAIQWWVMAGVLLSILMYQNRGCMQMKNKSNRLWLVGLIFLLPVVISGFLYLFHSHFHFK